MTGVVEEQPVTKIPIAPESSTASVQRCIEFTPWFSPETTPLRSMQRGEEDSPPAKRHRSDGDDLRNENLSANRYRQIKR
jgi:hypothetical protein